MRTEWWRRAAALLALERIRIVALAENGIVAEATKSAICLTTGLFPAPVLGRLAARRRALPFISDA
jgi:hypothetical protein